VTSPANTGTPIRCRRCKAVVFVARTHFCGRGKGASGTLTRLECACRGRDERGLLVIPGPTITADEQRRLGGTIIPVRASDFDKRDIEGDGLCAEHGCGRPAVAFCDFVLGLDGTCDRRMCRRHRHRIEHEIDRCPAHAQKPLGARAPGEQTTLFTELRPVTPPIDSQSLVAGDTIEPIRRNENAYDCK